MKNLLLLGCAGLVLALLGGCASSKTRPESDRNLPPRSPDASATVTITNELNPELLQPRDNRFTLGPGDTLEIEILGTPASRTRVTVGPDGKIYYYLLSGQDVWGLTLEQTRDLLERGLAKYLSQPQVSVSLRTVESRHVWALGSLNRPGIYPLTGPMTLLELLALTGGTTRSASQVSTADLADLRHSFLMRQGQFLPVSFERLLRGGDTSQNVFLQPDDFIFVPSTLEQEVYILGAVLSPRAIPYTDRMSLLSAIAGGNGTVQFMFLTGEDYGPLAKDANLSHVAIVRGSLAEPQVMVVDLGAILKGRAADVPLEPGDIIYVPNSPYTTLKRYVDLVVTTFVSTVAVNAGLRAGGLPAGGVNVAVPVSTPASPPAVGR